MRITAVSLALLLSLAPALGEEERDTVVLPGGLALPCQVLKREGAFLVVRVGEALYRLEAATCAVEGGSGSGGPATFLDRAVARARQDLSLSPGEESAFREAFAGLLGRLRQGEDPAEAREAFREQAADVVGPGRAAALAAWLGWAGVR